MFAYHSSLKIVFQLTSFPHNGDVRVGLHDCVNKRSGVVYVALNC